MYTANITDWNNDSHQAVPAWHANLDAALLRGRGDYQDTAQTDTQAFPMRIGEWKSVSHSVPFAIAGAHFIALVATDSRKVCIHLEGCSTVLDTAVIITKFNTKSSKFEKHQKFLRATSAVAIEHMRIAKSDDPMTISDYLAVANNELRTDGKVNIFQASTSLL